MTGYVYAPQHKLPPTAWRPLNPVPDEIVVDPDPTIDDVIDRFVSGTMFDDYDWACQALGVLQKYRASHIKRTEALQNFMGLLDTPISRRRYAGHEYLNEAIKEGRDALAG